MIEGECFCGAVKYCLEGALINARSCHCSRCRKAFSGAASAYAELADPATFRWVTGSDKVQSYMSQQDWGLCFCATCGTTLCGVHGNEIHGVALGTINGDPGVEIEAHIYVGSKAPWDHIGGPARQYQEGK